MSKTTIAFLINSLTGGGAERVMSTLLANSAAYAERYDIHLVLLDREPEAYRIPDFVQVHRLDARKSLAASIRQAAGTLRRIKPRVVVSFLTRANLVNVLMRRVVGHRAIISERAHTSGHHKPGLAGAATRLLIKALYPRADRLISVSRGIADDLARNFGVPRDRIVDIPNPVDAAAIVAQAQQPSSASIPGPYILGMGRLIKSKNFALLIEAFARSTYPGRLVVLGQGPELEVLKELATQLGVADRTIFAGFQANPFPIVANADAYVLPSNGEGFPNSLVEAMCLGVPVISTNCQTGPSEILEDVADLDVKRVHRARFGILVPINEVAAMADAIRLATAAENQPRLANQAIAGASRYGLERTIAAYWSEATSV